MNINLKQKNTGFTLIEIMVATSIFMIIMLIAMGALITSSNATKQSSALRTAMDNVNFAMESMTRSIRTGSQYSCQSGNVTLGIGGTCVGSGPTQAIAFTSAKHPSGSYDAGYARVPRSDGTNTLVRCDITNSPNCLELVSSNIDIETLNFYIKGEDPSDNIQPSVYIIMKGRILVKGIPTDFAIQTSVSQRSFE